MLSRLRFVFLLALFLPLQVLAQDVPAPAPSIWQTIWGFVSSPAGLGLIGSAVAAVAGLFGLAVNRKRQLGLAAYHAYQIVNDIDAELGPENTTLDKTREGLRAVDDWMKASGWRPLKPGEQPLVELQFKSLHGQEKQAVKVQAESRLEAAKGVVDSVAVSPSTPR